MRIVLVFVLALLGVGAFAQEGSQYIGTKEGAVRVRGTLYADSGFYLPKRPLRSARIYDTGAVYYQLSDSSAYVWTGSQWNKIGSETTTAGNLINKSSGVFSFPGTWSADVSLDGAVSTNPTRSWIMQNLYQFKVTDGTMAIGMPGEASFSPYMGTKYSPNNDFDTGVSVRNTRTKVSGGNVIINGSTSVKVTGSPLTTSTDTTTYKPAAIASDGTLKRMASWPASAVGVDSLYVRNAGNTGTQIGYISGDTLKLKRLQAGSNVTLTSNADSSITIAASGGGGGTPGGSNTQVQFNNSSSFGGDAGLTYNSTTNTLTADSLIINGVNINRLLRGLNGYNQFNGKDSTVIMAGAAVPTVNGDNTITWVTLFPSTGHNTYYVNTVRASNSTGQLHVVFPHVDRIVTWIAVPDDALATKGVFVGGSITLDSAILNITRVCQLGGYGYGDGTNYNTSFTAPYNGGSGSAMTFAYDNSTGTHTISNIPVVGKNDPYSMSVSLATSENWRVVWDFNGLSDYQMKFKIYDNVSNTVITGAPTTNHKWFLSGPVGVCQVNAASNSTGNDMSKNTFVSGSAIIFYGIGEK